MAEGIAHFLYDARREDAPEDYHNYWCACHMSFGNDIEAALVHFRTATSLPELNVTYQMEMQVPGSTRWVFARWLPPDMIKAQYELDRMREMASASETGVQYHVVRRTEETLPW
jgi:hypothetical protein